jgi:Fic family protein
VNKKEKLKALFRSTTARTRRDVEFERSFLEFTPGIGEEALARLNRLFPKRVKLSQKQKSAFMIDLAWSSSKLEGNSYTQLDTIKLLSYGTVSPNATAEDTQMIINHKHAFEFVRNTSEISLNMLKELHRCIADPGAITGVTRHFVQSHELGLIRDTQTISITNTAYNPPSFSPGAGMEKIHDLIDYAVKTARRIENPIESAFYILTRIPYIQAFYDCNKRVSRVMANAPLLSNDYMPISYESFEEKTHIEALLSVYEFYDIEIFRDIFILAYIDSCFKYYPIQNYTEKTLKIEPLEFKKDLSEYVLEGKTTNRVKFFIKQVSIDGYNQ